MAVPTSRSNVPPSPYEGSVKILDKHSRELYFREFKSSKEAEDFINNHGVSLPVHRWLRATLIPTRTDTLKNFAKDLFLPTVVNQALRVEGVCTKIFLLLLALPIDVVTLVPRLLLAPIKFFYDRKHPQPAHQINLLLNDSSISKVKIEIIQKKSTIADDRVLQNTQIIHHWVQVKVSPEDTKPRKSYVELDSFSYDKIDDNDWLRTPIYKSVSQFQSLSEIIDTIKS